MPRHIARHERAARHHLQSLGAHGLERAVDEPRCDALALQTIGRLGVGEGDDSRLASVIRHRQIAIGVHLEPAFRLVVANLVGHGLEPGAMIYKPPRPIASRTMKILWIALLILCPVAASAASPEQAYLAARDTQIKKIAAAEKKLGVSSDRYSKLHDGALADLENKLKAII